MNLGNVKDHSIDAFGDAHEYLMGMYASSAGKSGGEFFTPAEVSELLTRLGTVGKTRINKVYEVKTTGTDIDKVLPPISRFGGKRAEKKQTVIDRLESFFEKFSGIGGQFRA